MFSMQMLKDISFGKAICGMAICLLLAGYVECHAANYKLIDSKQDNKGVVFRYAIINEE